MKLLMIISSALLLLLLGTVGFLHFTADETGPTEEPVTETPLNGIPEDPALTAAESSQQQEIVQYLSGQIDSLEQVIAGLTVVLDEREHQIDSLTAVNEKRQSEAQQARTEMQRETAEQLEANARDLAKTFAGLKVDQMAPILRNVDDETILKIYQNMNSRSRKNILLALKQERAAKITEQLLAYQGGN